MKLLTYRDTPDYLNDSIDSATESFTNLLKSARLTNEAKLEKRFLSSNFYFFECFVIYFCDFKAYLGV